MSGQYCVTTTGKKGAYGLLTGFAMYLISAKVTPWIIGITGMSATPETTSWIDAGIFSLILGAWASGYNWYKHWIIPLLKAWYDKKVKK
jgi:hypothetical protein